MNIKQEQSKKYMEEADLTFEAASAIFEKAREQDIDLWAQVVKTCYDSLEHAVCSAIASKEGKIPIQHPEKISRFVALFNIPNHIEEKISFWLSRRAPAQYVDIKNDRLFVPHEIFAEQDAEKAIKESREIISFIKQLLA
jgi:HEPN domain-containing protein